MKESLSCMHSRFLRYCRALALLMFYVLTPLSTLAAKFPQIYVRDQQYRFAATDPRCSARGLCYSTTVRGDSGHDYSMNFIEFRDNGDLFDPNELDAALKQLDSARGNKQKVTVFIYIHGWHNNAGERDQGKGPRDCGEHLYVGDVAKFQNCGLKVIADNGPATTPGAVPRVVGIYLAWHGTDFTLFPFVIPYYVPSYIFRRHFGCSVGKTGMEKGLQQILSVIQQHRNSYFVVAMGHSFGARALENADLTLDPAYSRRLHASNVNTDRRLTLMPSNLNTSLSSEPQAQASSGVTEDAELSWPMIPTVPPQTASHRPALSESRAQTSSSFTEEAQLMPPQVPLGRLPSSELPIDLVFYVNAATSSYRTIKTINDWNEECKETTPPRGCDQDPLYFAVSSRADILTAVVMPIANFVFPAWSTDRFHIISAANTPWMQTHSIPRRIPKPPETLSPDAFCFETSDGPNNYLWEVNPKNGKTPARFWVMNSDHRNAALEGMLHKIPFFRRAVRHDWVISAHGDVWNRSVFNMIYALIETQTSPNKGKATCYEETRGKQFVMQ